MILLYKDDVAYFIDDDRMIWYQWLDDNDNLIGSACPFRAGTEQYHVGADEFFRSMQ